MRKLIKKLADRYIDMEYDRGMIILTVPVSHSLTMMEQAAIDFYRHQFRQEVIALEVSSIEIVQQIIRSLNK